MAVEFISGVLRNCMRKRNARQPTSVLRPGEEMTAQPTCRKTRVADTCRAEMRRNTASYCSTDSTPSHSIRPGSFKGLFEVLPDKRRQGFVIRCHAIHRHALGRIHEALQICRRDPS